MTSSSTSGISVRLTFSDDYYVPRFREIAKREFGPTQRDTMFALRKALIDYVDKYDAVRQIEKQQDEPVL